MEEKSDVLLLDVTPHNLGIMIVGGYFQTIISKNTTVPTSESHVFTTVRDNQTSVRIMVFQGDSQRAEENELLGEFILSGLRKASRGEVEVDVTFEISAEGIVSVSAKDLETGLQQSITVTATSGLTEEEISRMASDAADYAVSVKADEAFAAARAEIEAIMRDVETLLPRVTPVISTSEFGYEALRKARGAVDRARQAIDSRSTEAVNVAKDPLERTLKMLRGVAQKMGSP
jgi:molecular chaperone DnaK